MERVRERVSSSRLRGREVQFSEALNAHQCRLGAEELSIDLIERLAAHIAVPVTVSAAKEVRAHPRLAEGLEDAAYCALRASVDLAEDASCVEVVVSSIEV